MHNGRKEILCEVGVVLLCFFVYLSWSVVLPTTDAPDEVMRFAIPQFILNNGYLPHGTDEVIRNEIWGTSYAFSVYGSAFFAVAFMKITQLFGGSPEALLIAARFSNVLFATGTVFVCIKIGDLLFKSKPTSIMLAIFVAFLPQYAFLSSYYNADMMGIFTTTLIGYLLIVGVRQKWRWRDCVRLGLAIGACALSYYYAYGVVVTSVVVYFVSVVRLHKNKHNGSIVKTFTCKPLAIIACALLVSGWFFVRNYLIYSGDWLGMSASSLSSELYAMDGYKPSQRGTPQNLGYSPLDMLTQYLYGYNWIESSAQSFVGKLGYMNIPLGRTTYFVYAFILLTGLIMGLVYYVRMWKNPHQRLLFLGLLITILIPIALSVYYSWSSDYQPQGRYLMGGLVPFMIIVVKGWESGLLSVIRRGHGLRDQRGKAAQTAKKERVALSGANSAIWFCSVCYTCLFVYVALTVIAPKWF